MKFALLALVTVSGLATAQGLRFEDPAAEAWFSVPFEERERLFNLEEIDPEWAPSTEQAIAEEIAKWNSPPVQLSAADCRETLCKIVTLWPRNVGLAETGQQLSYLRKLGLDHQGQTHDSYEGNHFRWVVVLRRR